ncbi:MAG: rRNA maturation RNase YbeY [Candidatus Borkfalkiaceae bacterium]|nr:rRNA maturation RNase YbeY [Clostridia bacterium]MDY6223630.1 rRNA maturation RNase YbeY [Christensenellaceae bacterium]
MKKAEDKKFILDASGGLDEPSVKEIESAMQAFVATDVPLKIECVFVGEEEIRALNREKRGVDKVTDVLSFPELDGIKGKKILKKDFPYDLDEEGALLIGSIAVCTKRAEEQAEEYNHSYRRELYYLIVHGILHCLGYDHMEEADRAEMRKKEEEVLGAMGVTRND